MKKSIDHLTSASQEHLISDALEDWLLALRVERRSPRTLEFYESNVGRFLWWLEKGGYPLTLESVQASHIRLFLAYLQTRDKRWDSPGNANARKPMSDTSVQAYFRAVRSYEDGDVSTMLQACQDHDRERSLRDTAIILLLLDTGIRASELCGLRLADLERGRVKVLGKGNKERQLTISPITEKAIRDYVRRERPDGEGALFLAKTGRALTASGLYQMIGERARQAGLTIRGVHRFRHAFAKGFITSGGPLHALQAILGHESPVMSMRYGRLASGDQTAQLHRQHSPVERLGLKGKGRQHP